MICLCRVALGLVLALIPAAPPAAAQSEAHDRLQRTKLSNGLEVVVVENHASPLATVLVAVRAGAFTQQPGDEGLAHLFEHLLFRSYGGGPSDFAKDANKLNASWNGTTSEEVVTYYLTLPSENTENAIRLVAKLIIDVRFEDDDLEDELPVVLDELERAASDPERALTRQIAQRLWLEAWYRKDTSGDSASLAEITVDRMTDAYRRYYLPNNAALIVTGDVTASEIFEWAEQRFGEWERGPDPFANDDTPPLQPLTESNAVVMAGNVADVTVRIELRGPSVVDDAAATYAADVLFQVLNDPGSPFQQRLVGRGPFQSISCSYRTLRAPGPIVIEGRTTPSEAERAVTALVTELDEIHQFMDLTEEDLAAAKRLRELDAALALERTATFAPSLAFWWASAGIDYQLSYGRNMNSQSIEDLQRFAEDYLVNRPKILGVLGSPAVTNRIARWLREGNGQP